MLALLKSWADPVPAKHKSRHTMCIDTVQHQNQQSIHVYNMISIPCLKWLAFILEVEYPHSNSIIAYISNSENIWLKMRHWTKFIPLFV